MLREHLRDLLASCEMRVKFNAAGGATVEVFDAYIEDVALIRDTLGVQLLGVLDLPTSRRMRGHLRRGPVRPAGVHGLVHVAAVPASRQPAQLGALVRR